MLSIMLLFLIQPACVWWDLLFWVKWFQWLNFLSKIGVPPLRGGLREPVLLLLIEYSRSSPQEQSCCLTWHSCTKVSFSLTALLPAWASEDFSLPAAEQARFTHSFPLLLFYALLQQSHQTSPQVHTVPYSQGCSFLPSLALMAPTHKGTNN